ncbi:hypothetical protein E4634_10775 [Mangrovimicrobium sediminis]|uniref:DUF3106 domain-containing protein n=1 Tax=Mangrovimicrobium sediminis TaxID=2562682 RepID=A0A4Z0M244_9GAMM|nr:hypothetical protein [Haliea sp. SAOS-164]TGD73506.1 hypothetical protein E4634_10775 [Haliea sp. SAOS-164]
MTFRALSIALLVSLAACGQDDNKSAAPSADPGAAPASTSPALVDSGPANAAPAGYPPKSAAQPTKDRRSKEQRRLQRMDEVVQLSEAQKVQLADLMAAGASKKELMTVLSEEQVAAWQAHSATRERKHDKERASKQRQTQVEKWQAFLDLDEAQVAEMNAILAEGGDTKALREVLMPEQVEQLKQHRQAQKNAAGTDSAGG